MLREWLSEPAESEVPRSELLLKLFFGREVSVETSVRHVTERRDELEANLALLSAIEQELETTMRTAPGLPYWLLTIRQGMLVDQALLEWCDQAEAVLRKRRVTIAKAAR